MALYYAPAIGTYLIAKCVYLGPQQGYVHDVLCYTPNALHSNAAYFLAVHYLFDSR